MRSCLLFPAIVGTALLAALPGVAQQPSAGIAREAKTSDLLVAAREAANEGAFDAALRDARRAVGVAASPTERDRARLVLASVLVEASDHSREPLPMLEEAKSLYEAAIPGASEELRLIAHSNLAALYLRLAHHEEAGQIFSELEAKILNPERSVPTGTRAAFLFNYARLLESQGDREGAFARYAAAWRTDPTFRESGRAAMEIASVTSLASNELNFALSLIEAALQQRLWGEAEQYLKIALAQRAWLDHSSAPKLVGLVQQFLSQTEVYPHVFADRWEEPLRAASATSSSATVVAGFDAMLDVYDASVDPPDPSSWASTPQQLFVFAGLLKVAADGLVQRGNEIAAESRYKLAHEKATLAGSEAGRAGDLSAAKVIWEFAHNLEFEIRRHPIPTPERSPGIRVARFFSGACAPGMRPEGTSGGTGVVVRGCVGDEDGARLPGVEVTITSSSQGFSRVTATSANGEYVFHNLLVGDYTITYSLSGFSPRSVTLPAESLQVYRVNAGLPLEALTEEITVADELEHTSLATTISPENIEILPRSRALDSWASLSPVAATVHFTAEPQSSDLAGGNVLILDEVFLGGSTVERTGQFVIDGVDGILIQTSKISAEYGRFTEGGLFDVVTKSGGNRYAGSFRDSLSRQSWQEATPLTDRRESEVGHGIEATLGGWFRRDHVWFFAAGKDLDETQFDTLPYSHVAVSHPTDADSLEAKITSSLSPSQNLVGSYRRSRLREENVGSPAVELSALTKRRDRDDFYALSYSASVSSSVLADIRLSRRNATVAEGAGATTRNRIGGTWIGDLGRAAILAAPVGCGVCRPEERQRDNGVAQARYFWEGRGSHDLVLGYDRIEAQVQQASEVSGSLFSVRTFESIIVRDSQVFPQLGAQGGNRLQWNPLLSESKGAEATSEAFYLNDRWHLDQLSLNIGVRYDRNRALDAGGGALAADSAWSPRLGLSWSPAASDRLIVDAGFGRYAAGLVDLLDSRTGVSPGTAAEFHWLYNGPPINVDPESGRLLTSEEALRVVFSWFDGVGGIGNTSLLSRLEIPGLTTHLAGRLGSPHADEVSLGLGVRLGNTYGRSLRVDLVHREYGDFRALRTDLSTGRVHFLGGLVADQSQLVTENQKLERTDDRLSTRLDYRISDDLTVGGSMAWSHIRGREAPTEPFSSMLFSEIGRYPELKDFARHNPRGNLGVDVRLRARFWGIWNALEMGRQRLSFGLVHAFDSGRPYGAVGSVDSRSYVNLQELNYSFPPPTVAYFFSNRDAFRTDDIHQTDLSLNYNYTFDSHFFNKEIEFFVQSEIMNIFGRSGVTGVDTSILDATNSNLRTFNPFTETPIEGVHWKRGDRFGQPRSERDFQAPRGFRLSIGLRF